MCVLGKAYDRGDRMGIVTFTSHRAELNNAIKEAKARALEIVGGKAETYAKQLAPVDTGRLRNSITHQQLDEDTEVIGTNVEYAPYQELGDIKDGGASVPAPCGRGA